MILCSLPSPFTLTFSHTRVFMEFSGFIHGPPASDHPSQLCMPICIPYFAAVSTVYLKLSNHSGELKSSGPLTDAAMLNMTAPP